MSEYKLKAEILEEQDETDIRFEELKNNGQIEFITFHPSYSYEEFIEGITIKEEFELDENKNPYKRKDGFFKQLCAKAMKTALQSENASWRNLFEEYQKLNKQERQKMWSDCEKKADKKFVLIIDEINRGDISKIFGELITLLEKDKRLGQNNELVVKLPCTGDSFGVPPNIYIIGTMNTADRSIALIDIALRRRFGFIEMPPKLEQLKQDFDNLSEGSLLYKSINKLESINAKIRQEETLGKEREIGHSFFYHVDNGNDGNVLSVWIDEIFPLLEEYFYGEINKLQELISNDDVFDSNRKQFTRNSDIVKGWINAD